MGVVDLFRTALTVPDERGEPTSARFRMAARRFVRAMFTETDPPILDVAGREGLLFDPHVSPFSSGTTVLDIECAPLREAWRRYDGRGAFVCGDLTSLPFADGAFGAAACVGTFYNLPEKRMIRDGLREMARVTRPGGKVIAEFRNASNPVMRFASACGRLYDPSLGDLPLNPYAISSIRELYREAGLKIRRIYPVLPSIRGMALLYIVEAAAERKDEIHA